MRRVAHPSFRRKVGTSVARLRDRRMHPAPTMLSRYLDGDLAAEQRDAVEDHVRGCLSCRRLLQSLSQTISGLSTLIVHAPSHVTEGIVAALSSASGDSAPQLTVVAND